MASKIELSKAGLPPLASNVTDVCYCFPKAATKVCDGLQLLSAGRERCLPEYHVSRREYPYLVIEYVFEGKGTLRIGNATHALYPGVLFCYGLGIPHDLRADTEHPMCKYFAVYVCHGESKQDLSKAIRPGQVKSVFDMTALQMLFQEMIKEGQRSSVAHRTLCERYLELILLKTSDAVSREEGSPVGGAATYERTFAFIENNYAEISNLTQLSEAMSLSPTYLCRLFRRFGQETPHSCIRRHKLNRAAELLVCQTASIGQISEQVGYYDVFHFSRLFKKQFGNSPKVFREMAGKDARGI